MLAPRLVSFLLVPAILASNSDSENFQDATVPYTRGAQPTLQMNILPMKTLCNFNSTTLGLYGQGIRSRWLGRLISPPVLPESISQPEEFHNEWNSTLKKFECKLQNKLIKYLPTLLDKLEAGSTKLAHINLQKLIQETLLFQKTS